MTMPWELALLLKSTSPLASTYSTPATAVPSTVVKLHFAGMKPPIVRSNDSFIEPPASDTVVSFIVKLMIPGDTGSVVTFILVDHSPTPTGFFARA
ncbi:hypothetical protein PF005_g1679 [Phytophthora fragariae]|uniref:Uncharacterized protein n=2 Tax=Phytophthora TaxID=4783 RepID=A0A6A4ELH7_9STRA|nr:hypothetical protein PF003_g5035 [Phytophthora fragariae]KAE9047637.1 hypothetical protein PR002_g936 [Phytophthora rubi]KAE8948702.1 hypothetical protein PF009_g1734 [Phytophthora fragariae]KAE9029226.1 hypothetical protein PF011_g1175 [Phytophthora fragariae]KAE9052380.1 hypothetical protein PR001_g575 [Phytophthora rubi]